jgi:DNA-binding transcriptional LysR family regulator
MSTRISSLDLRLVQQFLAVAQFLSFRKAAEHMHMAQPPLSQAIMRLEGILRTRLFERSPRGVSLTPAGEVFKVEAERLLQQADRAVERTQEAGRGQSGNVHVAFIAPAMFSFLPKVILAFREKFPSIDLHLHESSSVQVARLLDAHSVDIGFLIGPATFESDIVLENIVADELIAVLPAGHRLRAEAQIGLEELAKDDFVLFSEKGVPALRSKIVDLCRRAGFEPCIVQEAVHIPTVLGLVAGGLGVSLMPGSVRALAPASVVCKTIRAEPGSLRIHISAAYRKEKLSDPAHTFMETARMHAMTENLA